MIFGKDRFRTARIGSVHVLDVGGRKAQLDRQEGRRQMCCRRRAEFWANNLIKRLEALGAKVEALGFESTCEAGMFLELEELLEARN
jgi:beta-lactamase superfamily II metal-dependent hydrolase